jgi:superfamily I DNA and/or RNA helicase
MSHYFFQFTPEDSPERVKLSKQLESIAYRKLAPFREFLKTALQVIESKESVKAGWKKIQKNSIILKPIGYLYTIPSETIFDLINRPSWYWVNLNGSPLSNINYEEPVKIAFADDNNTRKSLNLTRNDLVYFGDKMLIYLADITESSFKTVIWDMDILILEPAWVVESNMQTACVHNDHKEYPTHIHNIEKIAIQADFLGLTNQNNLVIAFGNSKTQVRVKSLTPAQNIPPNCTPLQHTNFNSTKTLLYSKNIISSAENIPFDQYVTTADILAEKPNWEHSKQFIFTSESEIATTNTTIKIKNIPFEIQSQLEIDKDCWIQLEELEADQSTEEENASASPLHYFFEDEIEIADETGETYSIVEGDNSQFKLRLKNKKGNCYPKGKQLSVKINTYQIKMQLRAISNLQNKPIGAHAKILDLFKERTPNEQIWASPAVNLRPKNWFVLTDAERSGTTEQRLFVEKALNSPDFSILEGPPGSGKTTVILELICQLIKSGKRILLCGSTHVAVDNVLEKLDAPQPNTKNLIEQLNILPIRIGDNHKIGEKINKFQLANCVANSGIGENLLLDAANLVCGTTIGILQHPQFKQRDRTAPILPTFDYLIIDESSKTTFQEFLVPALYAQKWILVGDVMQLAPFSDRAQLVSNIQNLSISKNQQNVLFYLQKIEEIFKKSPINCYLAFAFSADELDLLKNELHARNNSFEYYICSKKPKITCLEYFKYQVVFFDINNYADILKCLPEVFMLFSVPTNVLKNSHFAFKQFYLFEKQKLSLAENEKSKLPQITELRKRYEENTKYFTTRSWADEIAWRVDRRHQLRLKKTNQSHFNPKYLSLDSFLPKSITAKDEIEQSIRTVEHIALPSILECLIKGLSHNNSNTTIATGFEKKELEERYMILKYQHRMHPDISNFPRTQFYQAHALLDAVTPPMANIRSWDYKRYTRRNVWINIAGQTKNNHNDDEVNQMITELEKFLEYTKGSNKKWSIACLTFYRGQERCMREKLRKLCKQPNSFSLFSKDQVDIQLHTVDKFQGQEADIVFLSMVQTYRNGFLDSPNRLNVALTRAKYQLVILGNNNYFKTQHQSEDLQELAKSCQII